MENDQNDGCVSKDVKHEETGIVSHRSPNQKIHGLTVFEKRLLTRLRTDLREGHQSRSLIYSCRKHQAANTAPSKLEMLESRKLSKVFLGQGSISHRPPRMLFRTQWVEHSYSRIQASFPLVNIMEEAPAR